MPANSLPPGGYVLCLTPGHLDWLFNLQEELSKTTSTAVVVVSYTLAPHAQYPSQLQQAAESLEWLTNSQKKKPSNVCNLHSRAAGSFRH